MTYCNPLISAAIFLVLSAFVSSSGTAFQRQESTSEKTDRKKKTDTGPTAEIDLTRWRSMLDQLQDQARAVPEETIRPQLMAEVANVYWTLDKDKSAELFTSAFNAAIELKGNPRDTGAAVRRVLSLAAKRDASLGKRLSERLIEVSAKDTRFSSSPLEVATELLKTDAKTAAQFAEGSAPLGLSSDAAGVFILNLAQNDIAAADKVYRAYLTKLAAVPRVPLSQLMWLAGYPFGYGEAYGFQGSLRIVGLGGRQIPGLLPNPALARPFLAIASRSVQKTLELAVSAPPQQRDLMNGVALFVTTYLLPEVQRHRPEAASDWQLLSQQALSGTPVGLQQEVSGQFQFVLSNRSIAEKQSRAPDYHTNENILDALERSAKLPEGCERDRAYAGAVLSIGHAKDHSRALATTEQIKDLSLRESVVQFLHYNMATAAIEAGNLDDARRYVKRVDNRQQSTLLYVKMAGAALRQKDPVLASLLLAEMRQMAGGISEHAERAAVLLASAGVYAQFDPLLAGQAVKDAIRAINQSGRRNIDTFSVLRRVKLACPGDTHERWYGSSEQVERFSLLESLALLSKTDVEGSILIAQEIEDTATRIRALIAIAKTAIES